MATYSGRTAERLASKSANRRDHSGTSKSAPSEYRVLKGDAGE